MPDRAQMREDYPRWHHAQVASGDIDPMYPVLRHLADAWGLDAEQRAWLVVCHVVWYHPGSTIAGFLKVPSLADLPRTAEGLDEAGLLGLPCKTERRGHRPKPPLIKHLLGLPESMPDGVWAWALAACLEGDDLSDKGRWLNLNEQLTTIRGNGRWAAYKTAEMWQKVCDLPVVAADAGHRYSSGPRKGLALLEADCPTDNAPAAIALLDKMTEAWSDVLGEDDIAQVETSLCDFHSLAKGRYYLGNDIDEMAEAWSHPAVASLIPEEAWAARAASFDPKFLQEVVGAPADRRPERTAYRDRGEMLYV